MSDLVWQSRRDLHDAGFLFPRHLCAALALLTVGFPIGSHFTPAAANGYSVMLNAPMPLLRASLQSRTAQHTVRPGAGASTNSDFSEELQRRRPGITDGLAPTLSLKLPLQ